MAANPSKKKVFLYGQWVEVTVLPPRESPDAQVTVQPKDWRSYASTDETAFAEKKPRNRRRKK